MSGNAIADLALVSDLPPSPQIPGTGPWQGLPMTPVIPDIAPYGERPQDTDVTRGSAPWPYNPYPTNYPAPGNIGRAVSNGLSQSMRGAVAEAAYRPGLTGFEVQQGGGNGAVIYDVASIQLYMRPAPLPSPQVLGMGSIY